MDLLLECSIRAVLIAVAVAAVVAGLGIGKAAARHRAWCGVLAAMLLLPAFVAWGPKTTVRILPAIAEDLAIEDPIPVVEVQSVAPSVKAQPEPVEPRSTWRLWSVAYWFVAGFLMIRLLFGTARAAALLRRASPEQGFLSSRECVCPITVGWLRPGVVLPSSWAEWPQAELDAVLVHEREHARRRDPLVLWFGALNRCIFWFHPLAWWLERELAALAEEACDEAVLARGCDPRDYSEYLIHQARAVREAGARVMLQGAAMGRGSLAGRIRRVLEARPIPELNRGRAVVGTALAGLAISVFTACRVDRVEKAAAGQPTMNELMHRQADETMRQQQKQDALVGRALTLRSGEALELVKKFQANPDDEETYWTLLRHYEFKQDVKNLDALYLWVIEHHPGGKVWPGYINPKYDRDGYERGKALWLANLSRPGATAEMYQSAAFFLEGDDWPLAESVLQDGRKAHPEIPRGWTPFFARHFARALLGPGETLVQGGVFHKVGGTEAQSEYAQRVRAKLAESTDGELLARTASNLAIWGRGAPGPTRLARTFADRAVSLEPKSEAVKVVSQFIDDRERALRAQQLAGLSPAEVAALSDSDRMLRTLGLLTNTWTENPDEAVVKARELLDLAAHNTKDPLYGNAVYSTNVILGKFALRHGDRKTAVRHLLAAADAPVSGRLLRGEFDMNLPRALIDAGERTAAAEFFDRMAPKMGRAADFKSWAADIRKGVNPETIPTFSYPGCAHDPC